MRFTPALGITIDYKGDVGIIKFICDECLTFCKKTKNGEMIQDVCIVVYSYDWDKIKLLQGHHRG